MGLAERIALSLAIAVLALAAVGFSFWLLDVTTGQPAAGGPAPVVIGLGQAAPADDFKLALGSRAGAGRGGDRVTVAGPLRMDFPAASAPTTAVTTQTSTSSGAAAMGEVPGYARSPQPDASSMPAPAGHGTTVATHGTTVATHGTTLATHPTAMPSTPPSGAMTTPSPSTVKAPHATTMTTVSPPSPATTVKAPHATTMTTQARPPATTPTTAAPMPAGGTDSGSGSGGGGMGSGGGGMGSGGGMGR